MTQLKTKIWLPALLLLLPGCGDFDSAVVSDSGTGATSTAQPSVLGLEGDAAVRAREAGPAMGATQRSTAQDGSVVFQAQAAVLPADTNSFADIYLRDGGEMILVSKPTTGGVANNESQTASISGNGQKVVFASKASNLVPGDTNNDWDIFLYDRLSGAMSRVSTDAAGAQGTHRSVFPSLSADGTKVAFLSRSRFGTVKANNTYEDVFLKDLTSGAITLVSRNGVTPSNFHSYDPTISGDGTKVAYASRASNLVASDTNGRQDIFVYNVATGFNTNITPTGNGQCYWPSLSFDGSVVAFNSAANNLAAGDTGATQDIFVWSGSIGRIGAGNGHAGQVSVAPNGQRLIFASAASNLIAGDTNGKSDVFVYRLSDSSLNRLSVPAGGETDSGDSDQPGFAWNNGFATFRTQSGDYPGTVGNQDKVVRHNLHSSLPIVASTPQAGLAALQRASVGPFGEASGGIGFFLDTSGDGMRVAFSCFPNILTGVPMANQVFVRDFATDTTILVSQGASGPGNGESIFPSLSADGRYVAFHSEASNLIAGDGNGQTDVFVRDMTNGTTSLVSTGALGQGAASSGQPSISADGRFVAFRSQSTNFTAGDTNGTFDVFVRDMVTDTMTLASQGPSGIGDGSSDTCRISANGRFVVFVSSATNLVPGDTNGRRDIFVRDLVTQTTNIVSTSPSNQPSNRDSDQPAISANGELVVFMSDGSNLVAGDTNNRSDIFARNMVTNTTVLVSMGASGQGNDDSSIGRVSGDGRYVAFSSSATNLVAGDTNGNSDVFVRDLTQGMTTLVSSGPFGPGNSSVGAMSISADGRYVSFASSANDLVSDDTNQQPDAFRTENPFYDAP